MSQCATWKATQWFPAHKMANCPTLQTNRRVTGCSIKYQTRTPTDCAKLIPPKYATKNVKMRVM